MSETPGTSIRPSLSESSPFMKVLSAFTLSLESELAGKTRSHLSFHALRPMSLVDVVSSPVVALIVEWRRIVAYSSPPYKVDIQLASLRSSGMSFVSYGIGITSSTTLNASVSRDEPTGARM